MSEQKSPLVTVAPQGASGDPRVLPTTYSNYFRGSGSTEEVILDFGMYLQRHDDGVPEPIVMAQRLVLTRGHAQGLAHMLHHLLQRLDNIHGPIVKPNRPPNQPTHPM